MWLIERRKGTGNAKKEGSRKRGNLCQESLSGGRPADIRWTSVVCPLLEERRVEEIRLQTHTHRPARVLTHLNRTNAQKPRRAIWVSILVS